VRKRRKPSKWWKAHSQSSCSVFGPNVIPFQESCSKLLIVRTPFFVAGAIYQKIAGIWSCVNTSHKLSWLKSLPLAQAKTALLKMEANFSFRSLSPREPFTGHRRLRVSDGTLNIEPRDQITRSSSEPRGVSSDSIAAAYPLPDSRSTTHCATAKAVVGCRGRVMT
jgi:hypothetical protein